eukprot:COSAG05_NODE_28811_length_116_cov_384.941176_1_plen_21_part_10
MGPKMGQNWVMLFWELSHSHA